MFFKKERLLGNADIYEIDRGGIIHYVPRVTVTIPRSKNFTNDMMEILLIFDINILKVSEKHLKLLLPPGWFIFVCKSGTFISDALFRIRIKVDVNEMVIFRRYSFAITFDNKGQLNDIRCYVIDGGVPVSEIEFSANFKNNALIDTKNDIDSMVDTYTKGCVKYMDELAPLWDDVVSYWDGDDGSEV